MPALIHPIEAVVTDNVQVDKEPWREELKQVPREFNTAANLRLYDLPNTPNVMVAGKVFTYDPADTTTPDNGTTCILDFVGRRFKVQAVVVSGSTFFIATAVSGTNTILATAAGMATPSATPQFVWIVLVNSITGPATISFNAGAALGLKSPLGNALADGEMTAGIPYLVKVTSTDVRIQFSGATW